MLTGDKAPCTQSSGTPLGLLGLRNRDPRLNRGSETGSYSYQVPRPGSEPRSPDSAGKSSRIPVYYHLPSNVWGVPWVRSISLLPKEGPVPGQLHPTVRPSPLRGTRPGTPGMSPSSSWPDSFSARVTMGNSHGYLLAWHLLPPQEHRVSLSVQCLAHRSSSVSICH